MLASHFRLTFLAVLCLTGLQLANAEVRVFTDTMGRTLRGELSAVNGDFVTIKKDSGQTVTVKASNFSPADVAYFNQHGLKAAPATPAGGGGAPAAPDNSVPLRIDVIVTPKKTDRNRGGGNYGTVQRVNYKIAISNRERQREIPKIHGTILSTAKVLEESDESQIIGREEFDLKLPPLGSQVYETQQPGKAYYHGYSQTYGNRYSGYVLLLTDGAGKTLFVGGSSDTLTKHVDELVKIQLWDQFDKSFKKTKSGFEPTY